MPLETPSLSSSNRRNNSDYTSAFFKNEKNQTSKEPIGRSLDSSTLKGAFNIFSPQVKNVTNFDSSSVKSPDVFSSEMLARGSNFNNKVVPKKTEYKLETFHRSNQDTCLTHKPAVFEGDWVQSGDFLTDCANSVGGELSLGQNIFIAYMPWEGYNFEDAILISERLVSDDLFTSVHIERYEIENIQKDGISQQERLTNKEINEKMKSKEKQTVARSAIRADENREYARKQNLKNSQTRQTSQKTKSNISQIRTTRYEEITRDIPDVTPEEICHLDSFGIVKIGSIVEEGDILVGKITPINKKDFTPYQKLLYTILDKQIRPYRDSSLRAPKGIKAKVIDIKIFVKPGSVVRSPFAYSSKFLKTDPPKRSSKLEKSKKVRVKARSEEKSFDFSSPKKNNLIVRSSPVKAAPKQKRNAYLQLLKKISSSSNLNKFIHIKKGFNQTNKMRHVFLQDMQSQQSLDNLNYLNSLNSFIPVRAAPTKKLIAREGNYKINEVNFVKLSNNLYSKFSELPINQSINDNKILSQQNKISSENLRSGTREGTKNFSLGQNNKIVLSGKFSGQSRVINFSNFSQLSSYTKKFRKNPRVLRTLQTLVDGQLKNLKIMKKLKNKAEKGGFVSTKSIKDIETIHIYLAEKRKIQVGDKMSGRHGNKGIVSQILPMQDMPFLPDGTPIDMVLNPLGVPSRMNVGQIYECLLGLAGKYLGEHYKISSFDEIYGPEASRSFVFSKLYEARCKTGFKWLFNPQYPGKIRLYDGRTGDCYHQPVTVGQSYMLRLVHMVDDKIHMRSTGPYSLVTQQPLRGRSKQGGQRLGEMEVWALEGYGAAFTLLEMLTVKSDDLTGRMTLWSNLILNKDLTIGTPEAFKVLICELQALCLDIGLYRYNTTNAPAPTAFSGQDSTYLSEKSNFIKGPQKSLTEMTSLMSFP
uniref:DNA-directed RNA polymerase n=1 Tax=Dunaliella salina TaxID=3046 RepID=D0FY16_DUNSA|nr:beta subunit of RNA polymerase fragment 2 [Dunaliella salina]ACS95102.1 beta subunit of RNA polymerase fragment 2 [Dunaliella salina]